MCSRNPKPKCKESPKCEWEKKEGGSRNRCYTIIGQTPTDKKKAATLCESLGKKPCINYDNCIWEQRHGSKKPRCYNKLTKEKKSSGTKSKQPNPALPHKKGSKKQPPLSPKQNSKKQPKPPPTPKQKSKLQNPSTTLALLPSLTNTLKGYPQSQPPIPVSAFQHNHQIPRKPCEFHYRGPNRVIDSLVFAYDACLKKKDCLNIQNSTDKRKAFLTHLRKTCHPDQAGAIATEDMKVLNDPDTIREILGLEDSWFTRREKAAVALPKKQPKKRFSLFGD